MKKRKVEKVEMVRVIVDCSNAKLDQQIPRKEAKKLYNAGKLAFDCTNSEYCTINGKPLSRVYQLN